MWRLPVFLLLFTFYSCFLCVFCAYFVTVLPCFVLLLSYFCPCFVITKSLFLYYFAILLLHRIIPPKALYRNGFCHQRHTQTQHRQFYVSQLCNSIHFRKRSAATTGFHPQPWHSVVSRQSAPALCRQIVVLYLPWHSLRIWATI